MLKKIQTVITVLLLPLSPAISGKTHIPIYIPTLSKVSTELVVEKLAQMPVLCRAGISGLQYSTILDIVSNTKIGGFYHDVPLALIIAPPDDEQIRINGFGHVQIGDRIGHLSQNQRKEIYIRVKFELFINGYDCHF